MEEAAIGWKRLWEGNKNPNYNKTENTRPGKKVATQISSNGTFDWSRLPLIGYEILAEKLDPLSLMNLCAASPVIDARFLEHFSIYEFERRELQFQKYCLQGLDRMTVLKILAGLDDIPGRYGERHRAQFVTWQNIFNVYRSYWSILTQEDCIWNRLKQLEVKTLEEGIFHSQEEPLDTSPIQIHRPLGGRSVASLSFPCPKTRLNSMNLIVTEADNQTSASSKHCTTMCKRAESTSFFQLQIAHFPILKNDTDSIPVVEQVMLSLCDKCITLSPKRGGIGTTRVMLMPEATLDDLDCERMDPIFVIKENVVCVWYHPSYLAFFLLVAEDAEVHDQEQDEDNPLETVNVCYTLLLLYTLNFPNMKDVWNKVARRRSLYIPVITEHKGQTAFLDENANTAIWRGGSKCLYHPTEPTYYGLALVSPLRTIETFKPSELPAEASTVRESFEPQIFMKVSTGEKYFKAIRQAKLSASGHGVFVICSDAVIGVSWDGMTWLYGDIVFPPPICVDEEMQAVEVISEDGLMFVAKDQFFLMQMIVTTRLTDPSYTRIEPKLELQLLRVFDMDFASRSLEISRVELSFDFDSPFLFVVVDSKKPIQSRNQSFDEDDNDDEGEAEVRLSRTPHDRIISRIEFY